MDQPHETPPQAAREAAGAHAAANGTRPPWPADLEAQIAAAAATLESLDVRVRNVQALNLMIFGAIVLLFALEYRDLAQGR